MIPIAQVCNNLEEIDITSIDFDVQIKATEESEQFIFPLGIDCQFYNRQLFLTQTQSLEEINQLSPNQKHDRTIRFCLNKKTLESIKIKTTSGRIFVDQINLPETALILRTTDGTIRIQNARLRQLKAKGTTLKLKVVDSEVQKGSYFVFEKGRLKLHRFLGDDLKLEGTEGIVSIKDQSTFHKVEGKLKTGSFITEQLRSDQVNIKMKKQGCIKVERSIIERLSAIAKEGCILVSLPENIKYGVLEIDSDRPLEGELPGYAKNKKTLVLKNEKGPIQFK